MSSGHKIYIAVVDDDASVCRAMARLLQQAGFQPVTYGSAEDLMRDKNRPRFGCLLLDVQLVEKSGIDFQQQLASAGETTPIIFITANDDPKAREQAERAGCVAYLRKTTSGDELLGFIRRAVGLRGQTPGDVTRPGT